MNGQLIRRWGLWGERIVWWRRGWWVEIINIALYQEFTLLVRSGGKIEGYQDFSRNSEDSNTTVFGKAAVAKAKETSNRRTSAVARLKMGAIRNMEDNLAMLD